MNRHKTEDRLYRWTDGEEVLAESDMVLAWNEDRTFTSRVNVATMILEPDGTVTWNEVETGDVIDDVLAWMRLPERFEEEE